MEKLLWIISFDRSSLANQVIFHEKFHTFPKGLVAHVCWSKRSLFRMHQQNQAESNDELGTREREAHRQIPDLE